MALIIVGRRSGATTSCVGQKGGGGLEEVGINTKMPEKQIEIDLHKIRFHCRGGGGGVAYVDLTISDVQYP